MILDFYEQADIFQIAKCKRQNRLIAWLKSNRIPFTFDTQQRILAHTKAAVGVVTGAKPEKKVQLNLE
jgi:hypothetical protein